MARKQTPAPSFAPLTIEIANEKCRLNGKLELDYSKPEAKVNGDIYVDMLDKAIKIKKTMEAALAEEIC